MNKILGIDLGTNSIGWALRNPNAAGNQIEKFGVLTFNKGVGVGKTGEYSYAAERTRKRSARRLYQSRKYRLWDTLENLIKKGYCPLSIENLNKWRHYSKEEAFKNNNGGRIYPVNDIAFDKWIKLDFNNDGLPDYTSPYQLRKELADTQLNFTQEENRYKLGRALYHIAQRRGFKSSRKGVDETKEAGDEEIVDLQYSEKKKNKIITEKFDKYPDAKTIGWLYALLENDNERIRESIAQYAIRENYKDEIKYIFSFQGLGFDHELYIKIVESGRNKNDGSIFYRRPLRSQKGLIGKCTLEPGKYRAPVSHPSYELFRAWSFINNIKYKDLSAIDGHWQTLPLSLKQEILEAKFFRKSRTYFPFSEIMELIAKKSYKWIFNYSPKTTVTGCPVSARLKDIFGEHYESVRIPKASAARSAKNYYDITDIWHILFSYEDQEFVSEFAEQKLQLSPEKGRQFVIAWNTLPVGYGMLSLNAIQKINRFLKKGLIYTEAVLLANIPAIVGEIVWNDNEQLLLNHISGIIEENRRQKTILGIVNSLISTHKNLEQKFGYKDNDYLLDDQDKIEIQQAIEEGFGAQRWNALPEAEQQFMRNTITDCYQAYFKTSGLIRKDINSERHFEIRSGHHYYYKTDSGYYRLPKLIDTLSSFLETHFNLAEKKLQTIYHPSEINIYPPSKADRSGIIKLGSPKTGSFKNPMAMRALHELRKLINYLIETNQIDSDTRVVVEVARELNDSNKRWAIETWQKQREAENQEFSQAIEEFMRQNGRIINNEDGRKKDIDKMRLWYEQNNEEAIPPISDIKKEIKGIRWIENRKDSYKQIAAQKSMVDKYRLWKEQECQCIYTGKMINISDLFNDNVIDFEHTIPRSISFDNSLANQTVCYSDFNRNEKKNMLPSHLKTYEAILPRIEKWKGRVERIKQQIDFWKTKSKKAADKSGKDDAIRQRHLWQMELDYWQNKVDRFTMQEVTSGFKNSQKVDTQLISRYAFHYLKSYFEKVDIQKGSITAEFRKIYGLQATEEKKDRGRHSHHAKDAAVLTLIPIAVRRDELLKEYYEHRERRQSFTTEPYKGFKREYIWAIDDSVLINNISRNQTLTPAKRKIRNRGKEELIEGTNKPKWATGDCIRGQLHQETFYGAIKPAKRNEKGSLLKDEGNKFIQEDKIRYVIRVPFQYKKDTNTPGFKTLEEIEKQIVDEGLKVQIRRQVTNAGGLKEAFEKGIFMLDKNGNKVNQKIRHIRIWASVSEPLSIKKQTNLSKTDYKQHYYAGNATNSYFALYLGNARKYFDFRNLFETARVLSATAIRNPSELFEPIQIVGKGKKTYELPLRYVLENGMKVLFIKEMEEDIQSLPLKELSQRLYVYTNFEKDGRLNFRHHLEARNKIEEHYSESDIDFSHPKPTLRFSYTKYDFLVEGYDFNVNMDGSILFKKSL